MTAPLVSLAHLTAPALTSLMPLLFCCAAALLVAPAPRAQRRAQDCGVRSGQGTSGRKAARGCRVRLPVHLARWGVPAALGMVGLVMVRGSIGVGVAGAIAAGTVRRLVKRAQRDRNAVRQRAQLADGLTAVIAELRVGAHPAAAAEAAAREGIRGDAANALRTAAGRSRLGGDAAAGLRRPDSVIAADLDRVSRAWAVAEQHGLALAELLGPARQDLLERMRFRARTDAALAGARASAVVLAGLPVLGIVLGELMGARPLQLLIGPGLGSALLVIGVGLICLGLLWAELLIRRVTEVRTPAVGAAARGWNRAAGTTRGVASCSVPS